MIAGSLPLKHRQTLLWSVPAGAGVCAAAFAFVCGAKNWKGYARAAGAAALGALICVIRSNDLAKVFARVAEVFRKAGDPHGSLSPLAGYAQRLAKLGAAARDEALNRIQDTGTEQDLQTAIDLELKAFDKLDFAPGVPNSAVRVTEDRHRQLVDRAVETLSPSFARRVLLKRLAASYHEQVIQPELHANPPQVLDLATKLNRIEHAQAALHHEVYAELLRHEGSAWYPQKKDYPARGNEILAKMQMAAANCHKGECTVSTFLRVADDGLAELLQHGLEHLSKQDSDGLLKKLKDLVHDYSGEVKIRDWSATVYERQAKLEAEAFAHEMRDPENNPAGDRPPIQQLQVADKSLSHMSFPLFARMAVREMWAEAAQQLSSLKDVPAFRKALRQELKEGVLPRSKSCLYEFLDEAIADTLVARWPLDLSSQSEALLGPELTAAAVAAKLKTEASDG